LNVDRFSSLHFGVGSVFTGITPATANPHHLPALQQRFRRLLVGFPAHFLDIIELPDNPRIDLQWVSLCPTAGLVLLRGGNPEPEVIGVMLNGLESEQDLETVRRHTPMLRGRWEEIDRLSRPTAVNAYLQVTRMLDPAVATVLHAFASSYFDLFGTAAHSG
jgi:hypothetical protein